VDYAEVPVGDVASIRVFSGPNSPVNLKEKP